MKVNDMNYNDEWVKSFPDEIAFIETATKMFEKPQDELRAVYQAHCPTIAKHVEPEPQHTENQGEGEE